MGKIYGVSGYPRLRKGYELNINQIQTKAFQVSSAAPSTGIFPGELLIRTGVTQVYTNSDVLDNAGVVGNYAGIALATNIKLDKSFPMSANGTSFLAGESGACLVRGEVAVDLTGTAPAEGDAVYYDISERAFTNSSASGANVALANMKFSGITEGNLTVVNILY